MIRTLIIFAALIGVGMTSQAALALSQGESKATPKDTAKLAAPVRGDFAEPAVNNMIRLQAVRRAVIAMDEGYYKDQRTRDTSGFTRLYAQREGRWQMIASRSSAIVL